jgi:hypothetical protein
VNKADDHDEQMEKLRQTMLRLRAKADQDEARRRDNVTAARKALPDPVERAEDGLKELEDWFRLTLNEAVSPADDQRDTNAVIAKRLNSMLGRAKRLTAELRSLADDLQDLTDEIA